MSLASLSTSRPRTLLMATAIAFAASCNLLSSGGDATGVHLTILSPQSVGAGTLLDEFRTRAQFPDGPPLERITTLGRSADGSESVDVLFPDQRAGEEVQLLVEGVSSGTVTASGRTVVTLQKGRLVDAAITLRLCAAASGSFCDGDTMVACDPVSDETVFVSCDYGCNRAAGRCNDCAAGVAECQGTAFVVCDEDGFDLSREDCADFSDSCRAATCTPDGCDVTAMADGTDCDDGLFCTLGTQCNSGSCTGGGPNLCDDANSCTVDVCDDTNDRCANSVLPDDAPCDDALYCTAGDHCSSGVCQSGTGLTCVDANPCTLDACDESTDVCSFPCAPAGSSCFDATQEVTCNASCTPTSFKICSHGCNATRQQCNECDPNAVSCAPDLGLLCNAKIVCDAQGRVAAKSCCLSNRCDCAGTSCLEDVCESAPDLSAGGSTNGTTCAETDDVPGNCLQGGTACLPPTSGGAPEAKFRMLLDDGTSASVFYNVVLNSSSSILDTQLRLMSVCGVEASQVPNARVCSLPVGSTPELACSEQAGPELMAVCGAPEGEYFGAVDSAPGTCGDYLLSVSVNPVDLELPSSAGNISRGGMFRGNTCGMSDDFNYPRTQDTGGFCGASGDCVGSICPACNSQAATDCRVNDFESKCSYNGRNSPDAVFYLALNMDSGIDISTEGSDFDTVLYIVQSGNSGPTPAGPVSVCNDDCLSADGPSHIQTSLPAGLYYVYLDGANGSCGNFVLDVTVSPAATCPNLTCEAPFETCDTCPSDCRCQKCGDGQIRPSEGEVCDDGDNISADGCSPTCNIEPGYKCESTPSVCKVHCGDGVLDTTLGEECDDRNSVTGDGCDVSCKVESGWICSDEPSFCRHGLRMTSCPEATFLAGDLVGIEDVIAVSSPYTVGDVNVDVDIANPYPVALDVSLVSATGTTVFLANNSATGSGGIVGNYDVTLVPWQSMNVFDGQLINGNWRLRVAETYWWASGVLHCWTLNIETHGICGNGICEGALNETCSGCPADCACSGCPDGTVDTTNGERCDDGGIATGDGCDASCQVEPGYKCSGEPSTCLVHCGDGLIDFLLGEKCDDNDAVPFDGCDAACAIEAGYKCEGEPSSCVIHCGDGIIDQDLGEQCDDGNPNPTDGCSAACQIEPTYKCSGQPSTCVVHCGDGLIDHGLGEQCDDDNTNPSDGCTDSCLVDPAYKCSGQPSVCIIHCGDGVIDTTLGEVCDDKNMNSGDGCSSSCAVEPGYKCSGQPSSCFPHCGDGIIDISLGENCDDDNGASGDGCSSTCAVEPSYVCSGEPSACTAVDILYNGEAAIESVTAGQSALPAGWSEAHSDPPSAPAVNWHISAKRSISGTRAWYYGNEAAPLGGSYANGSRNDGTATSPNLTIPAGYSSYILRLDVFASTEGGTAYDLYEVRVRVGGVTQQTVAKAQLGNGNTGGLFVRYDVTITAPIGGTNNTQIQFFFDTMDSIANTTDGVYFDGLLILGVP